MKRRRISVIAVAGLLATFSVMAGLDWTAALGVIAFAPWVALVGFDSGIVAGFAAAAAATALWRGATEISMIFTTALQFVIRAGFFAALGLGTAIAGRRLRASLVMQRALINSTVDGICLTDADGNLLIMNRRIVETAIELGLPVEGTVPERLLAIADKMSEPEHYRRRMLELASHPTEPSADEFEVAATGRVFRGYAAPVLDRSGRFLARIWTLRELTADRELDRMRDAFVATVSHELRTPLTSIVGFTHMLRRETEGMSQNARSYLEVIERGTERLQQLVEELLLIAQIEARRLDLQTRPIDLGALAQQCVESTRPAAAEKGIALELEIDSPPEVNADPGRVSQVLDNLVSNALKFTPSGGTVTVSVGSGNGSARVVVADTGFGIPADEQEKLFTRFFRSRNAMQQAVQGTGLGLAITKALVERHGGAITVDSVENEGTRVTFTLPA